MHNKKALWTTVMICLVVAGLTLAVGATENPLPQAAVEQALDLMTGQAAECGQSGELFQAPVLALMFGGPGECAYNVSCIADCQATSHACKMACPGYPNDIPWWLQCLAACNAQEAICAEGCCL